MTPPGLTWCSAAAARSDTERCSAVRGPAGSRPLPVRAVGKQRAVTPVMAVWSVCPPTVRSGFKTVTADGKAESRAVPRRHYCRTARTYQTITADYPTQHNLTKNIRHIAMDCIRRQERKAETLRTRRRVSAQPPPFPLNLPVAQSTAQSENSVRSAEQTSGRTELPSPPAVYRQEQNAD